MAAKRPATARHEAQDLGEQGPWDGDLREPKGDGTAMAHDLRANFDELVPQRDRRQVFCFPRNDRCWVNSRHSQPCPECRLLGVKRT